MALLTFNINKKDYVNEYLPFLLLNHFVAGAPLEKNRRRHFG
jgi:hypothetical protein